MDGSTGRRHDAWALDKALSEPWDLLWCCGTVGQWNTPVIGIQDRHAARLMCFYRAEYLLQYIFRPGPEALGIRELRHGQVCTSGRDRSCARLQKAWSRSTAAVRHLDPLDLLVKFVNMGMRIHLDQELKQSC